MLAVVVLVSKAGGHLLTIEVSAEGCHNAGRFDGMTHRKLDGQAVSIYLRMSQLLGTMGVNETAGKS